MTTYEPRTAENVLRAELASLDQSLAFQQRRVDGAYTTIDDARALHRTHLLSRQSIVDALGDKGAETPFSAFLHLRHTAPIDRVDAARRMVAEWKRTLQRSTSDTLEVNMAGIDRILAGLDAKVGR